MKWIDELAALPIRCFCNYCLLGVVGIVFEILVFIVRRGVWAPAYGTQSMIVAAVLVTILQTAVEFFRAEGTVGFPLRLTAAGLHFAGFSALILPQLDIRVPLGQYCCMLGILFWIAAINEARFRGRGRLVLLPVLIFGIMAAGPIIEDAAEERRISGGMLIAANAILFMILYRTWSVHRKKTSPREMPQNDE